MMLKITKSQLKLGATITLDGFPEGTVIFEEKCTLESFIDGEKKKRWPCWTIRTKAPRPLNKYFFVDWGKDGLFVFKKTKLKFAPPTAKLWVERSGLEEMENTSGVGPESSIYSMLVFNMTPKSKKPSKLFCIERCRNFKIFRYEGFRIEVVPKRC